MTRSGMRVPYNLLDRWICIHCYLMSRYPDTNRNTIREALRCGRSCVRARAARRTETAT